MATITAGNAPGGTGFGGTIPPDPSYPDLSPLETGLAGKCPRCGQGPLFHGYLTVAPSCSVCGLSFAFADAGDAAAWFVMLIGCVLGVGAMLVVEVMWQPSYWVHGALAIPLLVGMPLVLLRPVKGIFLNQHWKMSAGEGQLQQ